MLYNRVKKGSAIMSIDIIKAYNKIIPPISFDVEVCTIKFVSDYLGTIKFDNKIIVLSYVDWIASPNIYNKRDGYSPFFRCDGSQYNKENLIQCADSDGKRFLVRVSRTYHIEKAQGYFPFLEMKETCESVSYIRWRKNKTQSEEGEKEWIALGRHSWM